MKLNTFNKSIPETLIHIVKSVLPNTINSGLSRHLRGSINPDPKSKGKAIIFKWNNNQFKVTENLTAYEQNWCNDWIKTEESAKVEADIKAFHERMYAVVKVQIAA